MIRSVCILALCLRALSSAEPSTDDGHKWTVGHLSIPFPSNAIFAGTSPDGIKHYVGRINSTEVGTLPARVSAESGIARYGYRLDNGHPSAEMLSSSYDLLLDEGDFVYTWTRSHSGVYEKGNVDVGTSVANYRVFICRAWVNDRLLLGTLNPNETYCFIFRDNGLGYAASVLKYEVLVARSKCKN